MNKWKPDGIPQDTFNAVMRVIDINFPELVALKHTVSADEFNTILMATVSAVVIFSTDDVDDMDDDETADFMYGVVLFANNYIDAKLDNTVN